MAQKKILAGIELPNTSADLDSNPSAGFSRLSIINNKLYLKSSDGTSKQISFEDFFASLGEVDPQFTYTAGTLIRIDYSSGNYKLFTYDINENLSILDYVRAEGTFRKVFTYDVEGTLTGITYSII
jgi:hypothetical protein